jgi:hypothetical protein
VNKSRLLAVSIKSVVYRKRTSVLKKSFSEWAAVQKGPETRPKHTTITSFSAPGSDAEESAKEFSNTLQRFWTGVDERYSRNVVEAGFSEVWDAALPKIGNMGMRRL